MNLQMTDQQLQKVLECVAQCHAVEWMKGNDNSDLEAIIQSFGTSLKECDKEAIFHKVFVACDGKP
jgi:hypothetical protein